MPESPEPGAPARPEAINLAEAFDRIPEPWQPRVAAQVNDFQVRLVKLEGTFVWHSHEDEDELFLVIAGRMLMELRDRDVIVSAGELIVVPAGVEHRPSATEEAHVLLLERATTVNTGTAGGERTVAPEPL